MFLVDQKIISKIEQIVGKDGYTTDVAKLYTYGFDASIFHSTPEIVIQPRTTEQVSEIMKIANAELIPVVPRGAGTGLCGSAVPMKGGIVIGNPIPQEYALDYDEMDKVIVKALKKADELKIRGKNITPFLLARIKDVTGGDSLASNIQLAFNNARMAAKIAAAGFHNLLMLFSTCLC